MIRIEGLAFRYPSGEFRLSVSELAVDDGDSVAIIGPSGCGKTTLLRLIAGILVPDSGRLNTNGVDLTSLGDDARRDFRLRTIGMVFQEFELLEYLSVRDNIQLPFRIGRTLTLDAEAHARTRALASKVGLADKLGRLPDHLSQGERQRVAVCRALATSPVLLLADEPTGNLDPKTGRRVMDELIEFAGEERATLVVVTHDHAILERFGRVVDFQDFYVEAAAT